MTIQRSSNLFISGYLIDLLQSIRFWFSSCSAKQLVLFSSLLILASSIAFGLWFKIKQLSIVSVEIVKFYPISSYFNSILKTLAIFIIIWLLLVLLNYKFREGDADNKLPMDLFLSSLPFGVFFLAWFDVVISIQFLLFALLCGTHLINSILRGSISKFIRVPFFILILYIIIFFVVLQGYSPLYHDTFWDTWGRGDWFVNMEHQWENAKAYDFLGNFTQSGFLGGHTQGLLTISELSALIILILDIPIIDLFGKYTSLKFFFFGLYIFGSFGSYLFFRHGLKLSNFVSSFGGLGFFYGNSAYLTLMGGEFPLYMTQFVFFPWVLLFIKSAHSTGNPLISCFSGLFASLPEYVMGAHPESDFIYFIFCNIYNLYLCFCRYFSDGNLKISIKILFGWLLIFPIFHGIGLAYRVIPMFTAIIEKEYAVFDSGKSGLYWDGGLNKLFTIFFRFENLSHAENLNMGIGEHTVATPVYFFIGQPLLFFSFSFVILSIITLYKKLSSNSGKYIKYADLRTSLFFTGMYLFLSWNLPQGNQTLFNALMEWTNIRIHSAFRMNTYYFFFGLVVAMYGLNFLLAIRRPHILNLIFISFILILLGVYVSPLYFAKPDKLLLDGLLLLGTYLLILSYIYSCQKNNLKSFLINGLNNKNIIRLMIVGLTFYSYVFLHTRLTPLLIKSNNSFLHKKWHIYTPSRVMLTQLINNKHDVASYNFFEKKVKRFAYDFSNKRINGGVSDVDYHRVLKVLDDYIYMDPVLQNSRVTSLEFSRNNVTNDNLKIINTFNSLTETWSPKNISYLFKRSFDIFLEPEWRHRFNNKFTVVQRRFNNKLKNIEAIDIVFGPENYQNLYNYDTNKRVKNEIKKHKIKLNILRNKFVESLNNDQIYLGAIKSKINSIKSQLKSLNEQLIVNKNLQINFRILHSDQNDSEYVFSSADLDSEIISSSPNEKILRIKIGNITRDWNVSLKELIVFFPDQLENIVNSPPIKRINILGVDESMRKYFQKPYWKSKDRNIEFFRKIAPELDNFYLFDQYSKVLLGFSSAYYGPLAYTPNDIFQYYLPDEYQLYLNLQPDSSIRSHPVGKNSEVTANMFYGLGPGYPTIDINFHLRSLFYGSLERYYDTGWFDYGATGVTLDMILLNDNVNKILNILGIDFLSLSKNWLSSLSSPEDKLEALNLMGLVPYELPSSYKYPDNHGVYVFKNSASYGKAFIAKWTKVINSNENDFNKSIFDLKLSWPKSPQLLDHFEQHLSTIPNIKGATLIESKNPIDFKLNPKKYLANDKVTIKKIIGSKAIFEVDCKGESCWMVYNTAALNGWKAYSGHKNLEIHKANLGFIAVKLNQGNHLVWMEYESIYSSIGLFISLIGWIIVLSLFIQNLYVNKRNV